MLLAYETRCYLIDRITLTEWSHLPDISIPVLNKTFVLCQSRNNGKPCGSINLDILNLPHKIEHDGSMSRNDKKRIGKCHDHED